MSESLSEARRWEAGCETDIIRNEFIIPEMARMLSGSGAQRILDVGAATGYIARKLHHRLKSTARWTLLDTNADRIAIAESLRPPLMLQEVVTGTLDAAPVMLGGYDAVIVSFTLLEISDIAGCARQIAALMSAGGILLVALPDAWEDVIKASASDGSLALSFLTDAISLPKNDKFTRQPYPFRTIRLEALIAQVLGVGFSLEELQRSVGDQGVYLLKFRRND